MPVDDLGLPQARVNENQRSRSAENLPADSLPPVRQSSSSRRHSRGMRTSDSRAHESKVSVHAAAFEISIGFSASNSMDHFFAHVLDVLLAGFEDLLVDSSPKVPKSRGSHSSDQSSPDSPRKSGASPSRVAAGALGFAVWSPHLLLAPVRHHSVQVVRVKGLEREIDAPNLQALVSAGLADADSAFSRAVRSRRPEFEHRKAERDADVILPEISDLAVFPIFISWQNLPSRTMATPSSDLLAMLVFCNRPFGYSRTYLDSVAPIIQICSTLAHAHLACVSANQAQLDDLMRKLQDRSVGLALKDRRHRLKVFKRTVLFGEVVSWLMANGQAAGVIDKAGAAKLAMDLIITGIFRVEHRTKESQGDATDGFDRESEESDISVTSRLGDDTILSFADKGRRPSVELGKKKAGLSSSSSSVEHFNLETEDEPDASGEVDTEGRSASGPGSPKQSPNRHRTTSRLSRLHNMVSSSGSDKATLLQLVMQHDVVALQKRLETNKRKRIGDLLAEKNNSGQRVLQVAVAQNDIDCFELLLGAYQANMKSVDIHHQDKIGYTVLHEACMSGNLQMILALLDYPGIQVNLGNESNTTPFHAFCHRFPTPVKLRETFEKFVERGADLNARSSSLETPLHKACLNPSIRLLIVRLLLEFGADPNAANKHGESPLHFAIHMKRRDLIFELVAAGGNPLSVASESSTPLKGRKAVSALDAAREENEPEVVELLENTCDLTAWLSDLSLSDLAPKLIRENVFMDDMPAMSKKAFIACGVSKKGHIRKLMEAVRKLRAVQAGQSGKRPSSSEGKERPAPVETDSRPALSSSRQRPMRARRSSHDSGPSPGGGEKARLGSTRRRSPSNRADTLRQRLLPHEKMKIPAPSSRLTASADEVALQDSVRATFPTNVSAEFVAYRDLEFTDVLGAGTSGDVYRGYLRSEKLVAIKVLDRDRDASVDDFINEYKIMASVRGPHVLEVFGAVLEPKACLVMEYCSRGSLLDLLRDPNIAMDWSDFHRFSREIFSAVHTLHSHEPRVVHRDLKSGNFLVAEDWSLKVCDFGLSRFLASSNMSTLQQLRGTMCYCAPETFEGEHFTDKSDVYSLGIMLWEILYRCITGEYKRPYAEFTFISNQLQIIVQTAQCGLRPTIPNEDTLPAIVVETLTRCWSPDTSERPTAVEGMAMLRDCEQDFLANPDAWNRCLNVVLTPDSKTSKAGQKEKRHESNAESTIDEARAIDGKVKAGGDDDEQRLTSAVASNFESDSKPPLVSPDHEDVEVTEVLATQPPEERQSASLKGHDSVKSAASDKSVNENRDPKKKRRPRNKSLMDSSEIPGEGKRRSRHKKSSSDSETNANDRKDETEPAENFAVKPPGDRNEVDEVSRNV